LLFSGELRSRKLANRRHPKEPVKTTTKRL
jgi:hypothetical protein